MSKIGQEKWQGESHWQPRQESAGEQQADQGRWRVQLAGANRQQHEEQGDDVREVPRGPDLSGEPHDRPEPKNKG